MSFTPKCKLLRVFEVNSTLKNIFLIWIIICGAGMLCIDLALKIKHIESSSITAEPMSEIGDKDDADEAMIQHIRLAFYSPCNKSANWYAGQPQHGFRLRELKPPRPAKSF